MYNTFIFSSMESEIHVIKYGWKSLIRKFSWIWFIQYTMTKSIKLENSINTKNIEKNWDSNSYFPYQCSPLTLTDLLSNRFQIIYLSIKDYKNFSQHLFQLTRSHKNKVLKETFQIIQPPLMLNYCLWIKSISHTDPEIVDVMHCITAFKSVTNSTRDHNWSRPKNFYQQLTHFLNIKFKTISRKKNSIDAPHRPKLEPKDEVTILE